MPMSDKAYKGGIYSIVKQYLDCSDRFLVNNIELKYFRSPTISKKNYYSLRGITNKLLYHLRFIHLNIKTLRNYLANHPVDLLHVHTSRELRLLEDLLIAKRATKNSKVKIVVSIHKADLEKIISTRLLIQGIFLHLLRIIPHYILFLSTITRKEFIARGLSENKTEVLYNFHSYEYKSSLPVKKKKDNNINLLFIGSLNREKGILDLFDAVYQLKGNYTLHICGDYKENEIKYEFENRKRRIENHVVLHGYVDKDKKMEIFQNADILILPSHSEGMPLVILEALHFGLPIITTPVGAIPELLKENENALFVQPKDVEGIRNAIEVLVTEDSLREKMSENNKKISIDYSMNKNISKLCAIYHRI
jgi:glycosyltransferase involved in cell wall biosynthesis